MFICCVVVAGALLPGGGIDAAAADGTGGFGGGRIGRVVAMENGIQMLRTWDVYVHTPHVSPNRHTATENANRPPY